MFKNLLRTSDENELIMAEVKAMFDNLEKQEFFDSKFMFEFAYYSYTVIHLVLQTFNIYKTELQEYNYPLLFFSAIFLSKRLWFTVWTEFKCKHPVGRPRRQNLLIGIFAAFALNFIYCGVKLFYHYSLGSTFCLFYPYFFNKFICMKIEQYYIFVFLVGLIHTDIQVL